ncbi:hypothetical protein HYR99_29620 [Candidatus Poribacteria bacterium]|nr:hypothetical protein [Candidatus Poribacteria bacterium]
MDKKTAIQRKWHCILSGISFACFFICATSYARSVMEEVMRMSDSVGYEISPTENEKYALFPEYKNLIRAEFLRRENQYFLKISYEKEGKRLTESIALSKDQFEAYRTKIETVDEAIKAGRLKEATTEAQKEGRVRMVTDAVGYGLWLYGPGTIRLLDIESGRQASGLELLIGGGSFMTALNATKYYRLGYGRSKLMRWGNYAGTLYGLGMPVFFESENDKAYWGAAMLGTPLGGLIAYKLSSHRWFEKGETDLIANGGLVSGLYGVAIPYLINIEDLEDWNQAKIYVASAMVGVPLGVFGTTQLIRNKPISQGRAHLISLGGIVGSYYGAGIVNLARVELDEHPRAYVLSLALGLPVGAYLGYRFTGEEEYTLGRARLISVGTFAGALLGTGVVLLAGVEEDSKPYVLASILGSAVGMWYTHRFTRGWGEKTASAINSQSSPSNRVAVSLPSYNELLSFGILALRKPSFSGNLPLELLRISF